MLQTSQLGRAIVVSIHDDQCWVDQLGSKVVVDWAEGNTEPSLHTEGNLNEKSMLDEGQGTKT